MAKFRRDRYVTGWNDTECGINNWTPHEQWEGPRAWALHVRQIAREELVKGDDGYLAGVIGCVDYYTKNDKVHRLEK